MTQTKGRKPSPFDPEAVDTLCELTYRKRLGEKDTASMIEKDKDQGQKLRMRSFSYRPIILAVLQSQLERSDLLVEEVSAPRL